MKIGILGGTFNPVHNGHIYIAEKVIDIMKLDLLYMVPSGKPPHKSKNLSYSTRCELLKKSISGHQKIKVSNLDSPEFGTSYTLNLLKRFEENISFTELFFVIGEDNISELNKWYHIDELLMKYKFVVLSRNCAGIRNEDATEIAKKLHFIDVPTCDISSTEIRNLLKAGKSIEHLVPKAVNDYFIYNHE